MNKIEAQREYFDKLKKDLPELKHVDPKKFDSYAYTKLIEFNAPKTKNIEKLQSDLFNLLALDFNNLENIMAIPYNSFIWLFNKDKHEDFGDAIKLYIPLDEEHLCQGAKELFTYIDKENLNNESKIRFSENLKITIDNIVVRVKTIDDAEKVINFVNSNEYIEEGLLNPNPFLIIKDNIGITMDGHKSYNQVTSSMMANYIWNNKDNLDNISFDTYTEYLKNKSKELHDESESHNKDIKNIVDILLMSVNNNTNDYEKFKNSITKMRENEETQLYNKLKKVLDESVVNNKIENITEDEKIKILNEASLATINKHGSGQLRYAVERAMNQGEYTGFTRFDKDDINKENNLRAKLVANINSEEVIDLIKTQLSNKNMLYDDNNLNQLLNTYSKSINIKNCDMEESISRGIR